MRHVERCRHEQAGVPSVGRAVGGEPRQVEQLARVVCRASAAATSGRTPRAFARDGWPSARRQRRGSGRCPAATLRRAGLSAPIAAMCRSHRNSAVRSPDGKPGALSVATIGGHRAHRLVGRRLVPLRPAGAHQQHVATLERRSLSGERRHDLVRLDHVGLGVLQRSTLGRPPTPDVAQHGAPGDAAPGPVIDPCSASGIPS